MRQSSAEKSSRDRDQRILMPIPTLRENLIEETACSEMRARDLTRGVLAPTLGRKISRKEDTMKVHLVTVVGGHLTIFDRMLKHYRDMGIDSLLVNVQLEHYGDLFYEKVSAITKRYGAKITSVFVGKWLQSLNPYLYRYTLEQAPDEWFLLADSDEFQVYAGDVLDTIASIHADGYDFIEGFIVDRVSATGGFPKVNNRLSLWEQFPLAGTITFPLLRGNSLKVVAARGSISISPGQHYANRGKGCPREQYCVPVHHFKWTSGLPDRLRSRIAFYKSIGDDLCHESERFISHCESNGGKINVNEPAFVFRQSGLVCPHEQILKNLVFANASLMPRPRPY
jgi:hypothetical protein